MVLLLKSSLFWGVREDAEVMGLCKRLTTRKDARAYVFNINKTGKYNPLETAIAIPSTMSQ
jgi:hypothetical protein